MAQIHYPVPRSQISNYSTLTFALFPGPIGPAQPAFVPPQHAARHPAPLALHNNLAQGHAQNYRNPPALFRNYGFNHRGH
ncbi:hypothetical protein A0H81_03096 [Grifola frondosa]|uniref:Uncharacterized protein n=1 Tax=Grifola frondosa TaxID=5627 RepID=A0A1C7MI68_GRIFR|nr:hypothetical protein A0H81_03096 [Grifola frondosa]